MESVKDTRKTVDPQKQFIKNVCTIMKGFGLVDCWYEPEKFRIPKAISLFWTFISIGYITSVVISELFSYFRTDLTVAERNDAVMYSFAHPVIIFKVIILYVQRNTIKIFLETLIEDDGLIKTCETIGLKTVRKFKIYCFGLILSMFVCVCTGTVNGIRNHFVYGIPVRTVVTYWPMSTDHGFFVNIVRFFLLFHWWYIVALMTSMDCLCVTTLLFLESKFRQLQYHFSSFQYEIFENKGRKKKNVLDKEMAEEIIKGVKSHAQTLRCAQNLQSAIGPIYSAQVAQSIALLAWCLVKQVTMEHTFTTIMANMAFITCMLVLTGTYMMAAGDITLEATLVSDAMFSCGWEQSSGLRTLLVMGIQRAHRPVVMTAFGIFDLSYRNYITVLRTSYSFFAIMY